MNIKNTIQQQYGIDIDKINIPKMYKVDSADIPADELEKKIAACRKRWNASVNGPNEQYAARDQAHLDKADSYEAILRDRRMLKAVLDHYGKKGGADDSASCETARKFFTALKEVNNSVSQKDFNFYMLYFPEERKNEKAIIEMLSGKEFKAVALKPCSFSDEEETEGKTKSSGMQQNRFQKESLSLLHKCELQYAQLQQSDFLREKYPALSKTFYDFLRLDEVDETEFAMYIDSASQEVFNRRQNDASHSNEYIPLTVYFNTWKDILKHNDVTGNFHMFKKLVRYPLFTPYLYLAEDVNQSFLEALLKQTRDQYDFGGLNDFLYLYFKPLAEGRHYSFTLDKKLEAMLKRIDQHPEDAEREKRRSSAAAKRRKMIPLPLQILRFFATWPIYLVQFVFESFRFAVINVQKLAWIIGVFLSLTFSQLITGHSLFANIWAAATQFPDEVARQLQSIVGSMDYNNFVAVLGGLAFIVELAVSFVLVPVLCTMFLFYLARDLDQSIDLMGYHKTFQHIQQTIEKKLLQAYKKLGKKLYGKMIWPILANVLTVAALVGIVVLIVCLFRFLGAEAVLTAMI